MLLLLNELCERQDLSLLLLIIFRNSFLSFSTLFHALSFASSYIRFSKQQTKSLKSSASEPNLGFTEARDSCSYSLSYFKFALVNFAAGLGSFWSLSSTYFVTLVILFLIFNKYYLVSLSAISFGLKQFTNKLAYFDGLFYFFTGLDYLEDFLLLEFFLSLRVNFDTLLGED